MNCRQAEQWLLLKDSGELPFQKRLRLERHLAACARCRTCQEDMARVVSAVRRSLPIREPGAPALAAIREAARAGLRHAPESVARERVWEAMLIAWRPALALAAVLLLCLGGWHWLADRGAVPVIDLAVREQKAVDMAPQNGEEFDDIAAMLVEDVVVIERVSDLGRRLEISALDRDLLLLEGLAI